MRRALARLPVEIEQAHLAACAAQSEMYCDPKSGLYVFTEFSHLKRGVCCGKSCRHCPYGHFNATLRRNPLTAPRLLVRATPAGLASPRSVDVLVWRGGVLDAASLYSLVRESPDDSRARIVLLTTFSPDSQAVVESDPEHSVPLTRIFDQAHQLGLSLIVVPELDGGGLPLGLMQGIELAKDRCRGPRGGAALPLRVFCSAASSAAAATRHVAPACTLLALRDLSPDASIQAALGPQPPGFPRLAVRTRDPLSMTLADLDLSATSVRMLKALPSELAFGEGAGLVEGEQDE